MGSSHVPQLQINGNSAEDEEEGSVPRLPRNATAAACAGAVELLGAIEDPPYHGLLRLLRGTGLGDSLSWARLTGPG